MAGTPPQKLRFELNADVGGVKLKIPYPVAGAYAVRVNGKLINYTDWDAELGRPAPLTKSFCGENRYVGVENFLEFYLTTGCIVYIEPKDAIMTKVRLDWTLEDFYADGGTTRFVDRLAASLGISAHRIKTVAVYEGSVIVDFYVEAESDDGEVQDEEEVAANLNQIKQDLVDVFTNADSDFGAPIMGLATVDGEVLVGDPIPNANGEKVDLTDPTNPAIVGDTNLWDDLITYPEQTSSDQDSTSQSTSSG